MLEEGVINMDKKSRQSSVPPKNGATSDSKKNDNNSPNRFAKYGKKRESGGARGGTPDYARRPTPQKSRTTGDKRPRSRGYCNDRQREEVAEREDPEYGSPLFTGGSKKANLNHLLNFTFAGRETHRGSAGGYRGGRRPRTFGRVYNKERFLQANCQFVVGDGGDYTVHSIDADTLVDWELVEQVRTLSHEPPTCPICLQEPQAGKITRCGHIYCWACILHYLELGDKKWRKCPICYDLLSKSDLKSVQIRVVHAYKPGERITLRLMKRERGSTYSVPISQWEKRDGKPHRIDDDVNTEFSKLLIASPSQIQDIIIEPEKIALQKHMDTAEDSEVCFIEAALVMLKEREQNLRVRNDQQKMALLDQKRTPPSRVEKSITVSDGAMPSKCYASAFSDKEESDEERKDQSECSTEDADLAQPLHESPVPSESPRPSSSSSVGALSKSDSDASFDAAENSSFSVPEINSPDQTFELPSPSAHSEIRPSEGAAAAVSVPKERSSLSESSVGSPDSHFPIPEIQQSMNEALPVDEAAEHLELPTETDQKRDTHSNKPKSAFFYYQASDGQHIYLHAVNARCLVKEYGSLEDCPDGITATIVDTESIFMTEELRKRLRYLNHLPLTCEFQVAELALKPPLLSKETLRIFADDIEKRRRMRQRKVREDKKRSKKIEEEENAKMGKFPEMKLSISSSAQFPSYDTVVSASLQPLRASPEVRCESPSLSSITSSPPVSPSVMRLDSGEIAAGGSQSDGDQTSMSFAQMLKAGKTKPPTVWPRPAGSTSQVVKVTRSADSEDSDNEDRVPVPMYQDSFSCAIQAALDTRDKNKEARPSTGGKKKKQKQKFTKLFTTSMTRGK